MIRANELRIGNWILISDDDNERHYELSSGHDIEEIEGCPEGVSPIPLTREILEACGFNNIHGDYYLIAPHIMVALDSCWWWTNSWESDGEFGFEALAPWREINFLHQLQNLYFALTGQELNYQP